MIILQNNHPQYNKENWHELAKLVSNNCHIYDFWNQLTTVQTIATFHYLALGSEVAMINEHKVLYDLSLGHIGLGMSGIPQDTRMLFAGLSKSRNFDITGHIFGTFQDPFYFNNVRQSTDHRKKENVAVFMGNYLQTGTATYQASLVGKVLTRIFPRLYRGYSKSRANFARNFQLNSIPEEFNLSVWRQFFAMSLQPTEMERLLKDNYKYSHLSVAFMSRSVNTRLFRPTLDTKGYNFALFQDARNISVSPETTKVIRYHDAVPYLNPDTIHHIGHALEHMRSVKMCKNAYFACNSTATRDDLAKIDAKSAENAYVIPCLLPKMQRTKVDYNIIKDIIQTRLSSSTQSVKDNVATDAWFNKQKQIPKFIMTLSTIEPRKNIIGLINAWLKLRYDTGEDLKLMVVGKPGWKYEGTLAAMRPHIKQNRLVHLDGVAQMELPYLYSAASCFVFPSFAEGFGLPPNEAMQCDCPVAVSDTPGHRYSCGDAALYFNPYDTSEMAAIIAKALDRKNNAGFIDDLLAKGRKNTDRYSEATVLPQWEAMFDELSHNSK